MHHSRHQQFFKSLSAITANIAAVATTGILKVQLVHLWLLPCEISMCHLYHLLLNSYLFS